LVANEWRDIHNAGRPEEPDALAATRCPYPAFLVRSPFNFSIIALIMEGGLPSSRLKNDIDFVPNFLAEKRI
jgi:hypothetical protein